MTPADKRYQSKVDDINTVAAETALVDAIQTQVEFANKHVLRSFKLRVVMEPEEK